GTPNTAVGYNALTANTTGANNVAVGSNTLAANTTGVSNTAVGNSALAVNTIGSSNVAVGGSLGANTSGMQNTAVGDGALALNTTGSYNIAVGSTAGNANVTGVSNIYIGNVGANESTTIRIGTQGTQTSCFIAGIAIIPASPAVLVTASGQLGVLASSAIYKQNIQPIGNDSSALLNIPTYSYQYNSDIDPNQIKQYGFIAEKLSEVYPELVSPNDAGNPTFINYTALHAMVINELQKLSVRVTALELNN
ncbi:MAG: tail fiber domain-containing protein, partial [Candidatus Babeliaceae bacterium]